MNYPHAADGLRLMFYGTIIVVVGAILAWIPVVGLVVILAGGITGLVGLHKAGPDGADYRTAFAIAIINLIVSLFGLDIISSLLTLAQVYFVCRGTNELLMSVGAEELAQRGGTVWKINLVCTVISVVLSALTELGLLSGLTLLVGIVALIVSLVGDILYLSYQYNRSKAL